MRATSVTQLTSTSNRPAVPASKEAALFQFVTVREPRPINSAVRAVGIVEYNPDTNSAFVNELIAQRNIPNAGEEAQRQQFRSFAATHLQSDGFVSERESLRMDLLPLIQFGKWLHEHQTTLTIETVDAAQNVSGSQVATAAQLGKVWEALIGDAVVAGPADERQDWLAILRAQHFLNQKDQAGRSAPELQQLASAEVVLPATIFPLPQAQPVPEAQPESAATREAAYTRAARAKQVAQHERVITDLRNLMERRLEEVRNLPVLVTATGPDAPAPTAEEEAQALALAEAQRQVEFIGSPDVLSDEARKLVGRIGSTETLKTSFILERLEQQAARLAREASQSASVYQQVFTTGGTFWTEQQPHGDLSETTAAASAKGLQTQQRLSSLTGPTSSSETAAVTDPYEGFYPTGAAGRIRPLGIADLNQVEQTLCCYKAGEVAHIENVMQGEYKERSTRRLRRSEETYDLLTDREQIQERDTITADRYELAREASQVLNENQSMSAGISATASYGPVTVAANANFASSSSATQADRQTAAYAKNVTDRSLQRIVERVREQRTRKLIEEYEENNKHGLDNRGGTKHVVGLYRWVDKLYRAQVVNYGRRLMFEFMVPEPGNFHLWAMSRTASQASLSLELPADPRKVALAAQPGPLNSHEVLTSTNYSAWAAAYGAVVTPPPAAELRVGKAINGSQNPVARNSGNNWAGALDIEIPEGYSAVSANVRSDFMSETRDGTIPGAIVYVADQSQWSVARGTGGARKGQDWNPTFVTNLVGKVPFSYIVFFSDGFICNIEIRCVVLPATLDAWKVRTFNAILAAYQGKKDAYDRALADAQAQQASAQNSLNQIQGTNPSINQSLIQDELKKGCIRWLFNGRDFSNWGVWGYNDANNPPVAGTHPAMVVNIERAQFIEQCFEWSLMTYTLYPYFWATPPRWRYLYQLQQTEADPLFLQFLQSGMARVHVSVRPGYEKAAMHFLSTGELWNGGDKPVVGSPLYVSIVDELRQPVGTRVGEPWEIRIPSTLTVLQAESGAIEGKGLPCECEPTKALGAGEPGKLTSLPNAS